MFILAKDDGRIFKKVLKGTNRKTGWRGGL
jgi:hypothetical protein